MTALQKPSSTAEVLHRLGNPALNQRANGFYLLHGLRQAQPVASRSFGNVARVGVAPNVQFTANVAPKTMPGVTRRDGLAVPGVQTGQRLANGQFSIRENIDRNDDPKLRVLNPQQVKPLSASEMEASMPKNNSHTPKPSFSGGRHNIENFTNMSGPTVPTPMGG